MSRVGCYVCGECDIFWSWWVKFFGEGFVVSMGCGGVEGLWEDVYGWWGVLVVSVYIGRLEFWGEGW